MQIGNWTAELSCGENTVVIPSDLPEVVENTVSIPYELPSYIECSIFIEENSLVDLSENPYSEAIQLTFTTKDTIQPELTLSLAPIDDMAGASRMTDLMININDQTMVTASTGIDGGITVHGSEATHLYTAEKMTVVNNMVILPNAGRYLHGELVTVDVPAGMFVDSFGNVNDHVQFTFTVTAQTVVPAVVEMTTPFAMESGTLSIRFSSMIVVGEGSITLSCPDCEEVITIPSDNLMANGDMLIATFANATMGQTYTVTVAANTVFNIYGNGNLYTPLESALTIHTASKPYMLLSDCQPSMDATAVPVSTPVTLLFDQGVVMNELCEITLVAQNEGVNHTAVLVPTVLSPIAQAHHFTASGLLHYTYYTVIVPEDCFVNNYNMGNDVEYLTFRTIRETAPAVVSFNQEGNDDVLLDAALVFTFDQEVVLAENAVVMLKPQNAEPITRPLTMVEGNVVSLYQNLVADRLSSSTTYTVYIPEGMVCNADGLCMEAVEFLPFTTVSGSVVQVVLHSTTPVSGTAQVASTSEVVLHFTDAVRLATSPSTQFVIYEDSTAITGTGVVDGQDVRMSFPLQSGRTYTYVYDVNLFTTVKGAPVLYDLGSSFSFTVADTEGPEVYEVVFNGMSSVTLYFNENVVGSTGYLYILNSKSEQVVGPISAPVSHPSTTLTVMLYGQSLPDDQYQLQLTAGFVKDLSNNESVEYFDYFNYDLVAPFIVSHENPYNAFAPIMLVFNEAVRANACTLSIEYNGNTVMEFDAQTLPSHSERTVYELYPTNAWDSAVTYTLHVPEGCFADLRKVSMAETTVLVTTPVIPDLTLGTASEPAVGSMQMVSALLQSGVQLSFDSQVTYMTEKSLQLVNADGCVLSTGEISSMGHIIYIPVLDESCLTGSISLVAEAGAIYSTETGAHSPEATLSASFYSFSINSNRPVIVSATAVYAGGLQIAVGSSIEVTFDRMISASAEALTSLSFVSFLDTNNQPVALAARYHGVIAETVLHIIVDEIFAQPASSQIRSVVFAPVNPAEGITAATGTSDCAFGEVVLNRLFSLPPVHTTLSVVDPVSGMEVEGPVSLNPRIRITFDQAGVHPVEGACRALMIFNQAATSTVDVHSLEAVTANVPEMHTVFEWSPVGEITQAGATFHAMVDNTCFLLGNEAATGASGLFAFVAGEDTVRPLAMSLCDAQGVCGNSELALAERSTFAVLFSEPVRALPNGHIRFLDEVDGTIVTATTYVVEQESRVVVDVREVALRANRRYQVHVENVVEDLAGNPMQPMTVPFVVITAAGQPHTPTAVMVTPLSSTRVMLSFTAARDPNLESGVSAVDYCHYSIITARGEETFEDVCLAFTAEPVTIVRVIEVSPDQDNFALIRVRNSVVSATASVSVSIGKVTDPVPAVPMGFALISITPAATAFAMKARTGNAAALTYTFNVQGGASYGMPILGYTFLFVQETSFQALSVPVNPFGASTYSVDAALENAPVDIYVKATSAAGSSGYSENLTMANPTTITQVPNPVAADSVTFVQTCRNSVEISWAAPTAAEIISSYHVTLGEQSLETDATTVTFHDIEPSEHITVSIQAANAIGMSEATEVVLSLTTAVTAALQSVHTGATYAEATFVVSFEDVVVECLINAGTVLQERAFAEANHQATMVFYNLVPGFAYSGLCWAYIQNGSEVSEAIPIAFTTDLHPTPVAITAANLVPVNNHMVTLEVTADRPTTVGCLLTDAFVSPTPADIFSFGEQQELRSNVAKAYTLSHPRTATTARVFCATVDTNLRMAIQYVSEEIVMPTTRAQLQLQDTSVPTGSEKVSVRPEISLIYDLPLTLVEGGVFTIENMETGAKLELDASHATVEGNSVVIRLREEALLPNTRYTYYMANFVQAVDARVEAAYIIYGEYIFTTAELTDAPTMELVMGEALHEIEDVYLPGEQFDLALVFNMDVFPLRALPVELKDVMGARDLTRTQEWSWNLRALFFASYGLVENAEYTVEVPACLVVNRQGVCNEATTLTFTGLADTHRPVVLESQPVSGQNDVPNDVPLKLFFSEAVVLKNVDNIILTTNLQRQPLAANQILINGNEVTIQLRKGYSFGNTALDSIEVQLEVQEDAFRDLAENMNEPFELSFTAVPQRCGSDLLSSYIGDECYCHTTANQCVCSCGLVTLFDL